MSGVEARVAFSPGTLVGERYRIVSALARGGFGVVYVAEQLATERRVALKLLSSHLAELSVDRLLAEARIASRVSSEHIVQVFDAGVDPDSSLVFVAMELLSGTDLADLVRKEGACGIGETVEYLRQVAVGLDKVHGVVGSDGRPAPIIHRDLKPANLFLTQREDGAPWIKILDFGAAKVLRDDSHVSGVLRGTPQYMAYEQASGGAITPKTDIWAFGLIAFFLLSGRSYWLGASSESGQAQIFAEVLTLPLVPPSQRLRELGVPIELGAAFDEWFLRCVNRDASLRYATAGDAARELARALDVPVSTRQLVVSGGERTSPSATRVVAAGASPTQSMITPDLAALSANARVRRIPRSRLTVTAGAMAVIAVAGAVFWWVRTRHSETLDRRNSDAGTNASTVSRSAPAPGPALLDPSAGVARTATAWPSSSQAKPLASLPVPQERAPILVRRNRKEAGTPAPSASSQSSVAAPPNEALYDLR